MWGRRFASRPWIWVAVGAAVALGVALMAINGDAASPDGPRRMLQSGITVHMKAGWNLVALPPGTMLPPEVKARYTQPARLANYDLVAEVPGDQLTSGWGFWLYLVSDADLTLASGVPAFSIVVPPKTWVLVGNPSGTGTADITGADVAYIYDPGSGYTVASSLLPGQAAWVYSNAGGTVRLSVGPLQTVTAQ
jgi:hypothetical protein